MKKIYESTYGLWKVTTEGDVEGKSIKNLGTFKGHVDEIALHLAKKCYYSLCFHKVEPIIKFEPSRSKVHVCFDINSGTWYMSRRERTDAMKEFFKDRPISIEPSNYFASFVISTKEKVREQERQKALDKLTKYEKELLGLEKEK